MDKEGFIYSDRPANQLDHKVGLTNSPSNTSTPLSSLVVGGERIVVPTLLVCPPWGFCDTSGLKDCNRLTSADWIIEQVLSLPVEGRGKKDEEEQEGEEGDIRINRLPIPNTPNTHHLHPIIL